MKEKELFTLTEQEKRMKQIYLSCGKKMLETPVTFEGYSRLIEMDPKMPDMREYYQTTTRFGYGTTLEKKGVYADRKDVDIGLHERYAFPIIHNHAFFEIVYVYSGTCINFIENTSLEMKKGDICFLAPDSMHTLVAVHDEDVIMNLIVGKEAFEQFFFEMTREKNLISDFFRKVLYDRAVTPFILFPTGGDKRMKEMWLNMYMEIKNERYAYEKCLVLYARLMFISLIRNYEMMAVVPGYSSNGTDHNIVAMLGYIAANYSTVSLKEVSAFFSYNESYISRMLKRHTGKNFNQIVNDLQMEHARDMLRNTDMSISRISQEVGCFDSSHLSRKFRKTYGISPQEYREKN